MLNSLSILNYWLAWNPGNGFSIRIGQDPMVGQVISIGFLINWYRFFKKKLIFI